MRARTGGDLQHPFVAALDRWSEELIERIERREAELALRLPGPEHERLTLNLAGWEQGLHTPAIALATMLHRSVSLVHGAADAWSHPDEAELLRLVLEAAGNEARREVMPGRGTRARRSAARGRSPRSPATSPRASWHGSLPLVLLAIQEMG